MSTEHLTPQTAGELVRLCLGLPAAGGYIGDAAAGSAVRADLHLDAYSSSVAARIASVVQARVETQLQEVENAQKVNSPREANVPSGPKA